MNAEISKLKKEMKSLGLESRFMEFEEKHDLDAGRLDAEAKKILIWWEKIFLNEPDFDASQQKGWFSRLRSALGFISYKFAGNDDDSKAADMIMKNIFQFLNYKPVRVGAKINWNMSPFGDREWPTYMNRHAFLLELESAYSKNGKKIYAEKAKELFLDWACCQNLREWSESYYGWSTLNAGIRGISWPKLFCMWSRAGLLKGAFRKVAANILIQNAEFLMNYKNAPSSNWRIFEAEGLFCMSMILPGLKLSNSWRTESIKRLNFEMKRQIRKDGCHFQNCPNYHLGMTKVFSRVYVLAEKAGVKDFVKDKWFLKTIEKMCEFSILTSSPDFKCLPIGDSGPVDIAVSFLESERLFGRDDFLFVESKRKKGNPPATTSCFLKPSGHIVFRSDWSEKARFLLFDIAEQVGCHSHFDMFNIHVHAYGQELICDGGRTTYKAEEKAEYGKTLRHNTVTVDGMNQNLKMPKLLKFKTQKNWGYIQAESCNYKGVKHVRSIVFIDGRFWLVIDSLRSRAEHDYVLNYHTPQKRVSLKNNKLTAANMTLCCESTLPMKSRLENEIIGRDYNRTAKAKAARFECRAKNVKFATLIAPFDTGKKRPECKLTLSRSVIKAVIGAECFEIRHSEKEALCAIVSEKKRVSL